jgi:hypothetical protein
MSNQPAFAAAIRAVVAKEVEDAMAPYREVLADMIKFVGGELASARPSGTFEAAAPARTRRTRKATTYAGSGGNAAHAELASQFSEGQKVQYRQGRGTFDARVVGIDARKGVVTLERMSDQKKVVRPAAKVITG